MSGGEVIELRNERNTRFDRSFVQLAKKRMQSRNRRREVLRETSPCQRSSPPREALASHLPTAANSIATLIERSEFTRCCSFFRTERKEKEFQFPRCETQVSQTGNASPKYHYANIRRRVAVGSVESQVSRHEQQVTLTIATTRTKPAPF
ncbi:hypothetical protein K0M31_009793 [Melipona bicolor]|uniref:Uncharacterized protein n=1 Tax=Melipona bicolor TaxID=60889 RepID=A0AA40FN16_9HYME|nr:hypothetical protein K0M31_009793 [Melipona bicolor]